jgi:hypothetical protein
LDCGVDTGTVHTGLAFVWRKQQEHNLREVANVVKDGYNGIKRESILAKMSEKGLLTLRRERVSSGIKIIYRKGI